MKQNPTSRTAAIQAVLDFYDRRGGYWNGPDCGIYLAVTAALSANVNPNTQSRSQLEAQERHWATGRE